MLWQEDSNSVFCTDETITCNVCGKKTKSVVEFHTPFDAESIFFACFNIKKSCLSIAIRRLFGIYPESQYLLSRLIIYKNPSEQNKREPTGLSLRYKVMKRDGFQCVLCGASGARARLEIDHIVPVGLGGLTILSNLQTLCFDCNRGKSNAY